MRFDILSRDLNVFQSHFLEASAGTGKTFCIEHLVVRLLIETEEPVSLEQILIVTFTRAATAELKVRIYRNLKEVHRQLTSQHSSYDYVHAVIERQETERALARIEQALLCYDLAPIYTLHGFCSRMLQELAFEAQVEMSDPEQQPSRLLIERGIKEHLKQAIKEPSYSVGQMRLLLKRKDPRRLIETLKKLVEGSKQLPVLPSYQDLLQTFQNRLSLFPPIDSTLLEEDFQVLIPRYVKMTGLPLAEQRALLCNILSSQTCSSADFEQLLEEELFIERMHQKSLKKRAKPLEDTELHYPQVLERLRHELLPLLSRARSPAALQLRLAADLRSHIHSLLEEKEGLCFDALLLKMRDSLQDERFVEGVRSKFRAAIIDEFQDTDPVQWELFKTLFPPEGGSILYLVGDPKQSIYAFRSADLHVYFEAATFMGPQTKRFLDTNFRATSPLVAALNALFGVKEWMQGLDVLALKSGSRAEPIDKNPPIEFWVATQKKGRGRSFPSKEVLTSFVFPQIASRLHTLHQTVAYDEMAILVKDRFAAQEVVSYLIQAGIPASAHSTSSLADSSAYFSLSLIVEALEDPLHDGKLRAALGSPLLGFSVEQIRGKEFAEAKGKMRMLSEILHAQGFGPCLQALLKVKWSQMGPSLLEEIVTQQQLYEDLRQITERILEEKYQGLLSDYLSLAKQDPYFQRKAYEEKGSVAVMTIHRSKGLEFSIVVALGLCARQPLSDIVPIRTAKGTELTVLDKEDPVCREGLEEICAEKLRNLYVGLTRAKQKLFIPLILEEEPADLDPCELSALELFLERSHLSVDRLRVLDPLIAVRVLEAGEPPPRPPVQQSVELTPPSPFVRPSVESPPLSFTALASKSFSAASSPLVQEGSFSIHTLPLGRETGLILHRLCEQITKRGWHHPLDSQAIGRLLDRELEGSSLAPWLPALQSWLIDVWTQPLLDFCLADVPRDQLLEEMEFLYPVSRGLMKGFADLIFAWNDKYYILDWKSNYLGPSDADYTPESMERVMIESDYKLQASIYTEALRRYVKLFDKRPFHTCFGGALYYFIRGKAVYHFMPHLYE